MSAAKDPNEVLASIRRLVAREVSDAQEREAQERPTKDAVPVLSARASAAARLVLGDGQAVAANGEPTAPERDLPTDQPPRFTQATTPSTQEPNSDPTRQEPLASRKPAVSPAESVAPTPQPLAGLDEEGLREMIREILREEVRTRMGPRINANIRRIVQEELARLIAEDHS